MAEKLRNETVNYREENENNEQGKGAKAKQRMA